jgi:membrane associated rhomboid family serine protease
MDDELPPDPRAERVVRITDDERLAGEWALVLAAEGIEQQLVEREGAFAVIVAEEDFAAAQQSLEGYDDERRVERERKLRETAPPPEYGTTVAGMALATAVIVFHALIVGRAAWFDAGEAASAKILHGEPWRVVTALTLHADWMHAFGNAAAIAIFVTALFRWIGPGLGAWLLLATGAIGNAITALVHGPGFFSVGASTAVFGAVGLLCGLQFVKRRRVAATRARAWVAIGTSLAILAMLGVGEHSDVLAHLFGLLAGLLLGVATGWIAPHPRRGIAQIAAAFAALAALAACWWLAMG